MKNHGQFAALVVASALLTDYVLTVAVSVSSGTDNIISAFPSLNAHRVLIALVLVVLLAAANLRGLRESGKAFAIPTYLFAGGVFVMIVTGLVRQFAGHGIEASSAHYAIEPTSGYASLSGLALLWLALRAFASGTTALTGIEAVANGVPAFRPPKSRNAATTLGAARRDRLLHVRRGHRAGPVLARALHAGRLRAEGLPRLRERAAAHGDLPGGRGGVRRRALDRLLLRPGRHGAGPHPGREHRVQRLPAAGLGARPGPVPAPPAAHPRRQAGLQQRHPAARRLRRAADRRLPRRRHPADPALHHRGVHQLLDRPVGHGAALAPGPARPSATPPPGPGCAARR